MWKHVNFDGKEEAYQNKRFMKSDDGRPLRILAEYLEPHCLFKEAKISDTITFFGSARIVDEETAKQGLKHAQANKDEKALREAQKKVKASKYYESARELAFQLTKWSKNLYHHAGRGASGGAAAETGSRHSSSSNSNSRGKSDIARFVVCSGGGPGIMEAANRGASEAGGITIGLNVALPFEQKENPYITRGLNIKFAYFFMRKFFLAYYTKAFVVFPGGFGTLDEFFEVLTLVQTSKMRDKCIPIVLFGADYWKKFMNFQVMIDYGTISEDDPSLFLTTDSVEEAFGFITAGILRDECAAAATKRDKNKTGDTHEGSEDSKET